MQFARLIVLPPGFFYASRLWRSSSSATMVAARMLAGSRRRWLQQLCVLVDNSGPPAVCCHQDAEWLRMEDQRNEQRSLRTEFDSAADHAGLEMVTLFRLLQTSAPGGNGALDRVLESSSVRSMSWLSLHLEPSPDTRSIARLQPGVHQRTRSRSTTSSSTRLMSVSPSSATISVAARSRPTATLSSPRASASRYKRQRLDRDRCQLQDDGRILARFIELLASSASPSGRGCRTRLAPDHVSERRGSCASGWPGGKPYEAECVPMLPTRSGRASGSACRARDWLAGRRSARESWSSRWSGIALSHARIEVCRSAAKRFVDVAAFQHTSRTVSKSSIEINALLDELLETM